jgi:hypothetical protein
MSWYDYRSWTDAIRKQKHTNTPMSMVRFIVRFMTCTNGIERNDTLVETRDRDILQMNREYIIHDLSWFVAHSDFSNERIYNIVSDIVKCLDPSRTDRDLEEVVCTNMPYWYAQAIIENKVPRPREESYRNVSYLVDSDVLEDFLDYLPFDIHMILEYSPIRNADLFERMLRRIHPGEIPDLFSRICNENMNMITEESLLQFIEVWNHERTIGNLIHSMLNPDNLFRTNISILKIYGANRDYWLVEKPSIRAIVDNPILTLEEFVKFCTDCYGGITQNHYEWISNKKPLLMIQLLREGTVSPMDDILNRTWLILSRSTEITIEHVLEFIDIPWDWETLSRNVNIATPENIHSHPELPWVWGYWGITMSPAITEEFMEEYIERLYKGANVSGSISGNTNVTPEFVKSHPNICWNYGETGLSNSIHITLPFIWENLDKNWDILNLIKNAKICKNTAAHAIQSAWRIYYTHKRAKWLANEVMEWMYHPDCKPAMSIRKRIFEEHMKSIV